MHIPKHLHKAGQSILWTVAIYSRKHWGGPSRLIAVAVGILAGALAYKKLDNFWWTLGIAWASDLVSAHILFRIQERRNWGKHYSFLHQLRITLHPPLFCPAILSEVRRNIHLKVKETKAQLYDTMKQDGLRMNWADYGGYLSSSLEFNEKAFMATCFLSPVQFLDKRFEAYHVAQEKRLESKWKMEAGRRFRIVIADKSELLELIADEKNKKVVKTFFSWHSKIKLDLFFIPRKSFARLNQTEFKDIVVNDFVYFEIDGYVWVLGTKTDCTFAPKLEDSILLKVIDAPDQVNRYCEFMETLKKDGNTEPIKNLSELVSWCGNL